MNLILLLVFTLGEVFSFITVFWIFFKPNFFEILFMILNIESVYIVDAEGNVVHVMTNLSRKNKKEYDVLVGGVVKGTDGVLSEIRTVTKAQLNRMILDDGTAIIVQRSDDKKYYYIVFTRIYTNFTNKKILHLKQILDKDKTLLNQKPKHLDKIVMDIFLEK